MVKDNTILTPSNIKWCFSFNGFMLFNCNKQLRNQLYKTQRLLHDACLVVVGGGGGGGGL